MTGGEELILQLRTTAASELDSTGSVGGSKCSAESEGRREIFRGDDEWPSALDDLGPHVPPDHLYLEGKRLVVDDKTIAVVGTRRPTAAGVEAAEQLTRGLVEAGCTIVSGLAVGIDTIAHRTALRAGGYTIGVLGCGLDVDYPFRNRALKNQIRASGTLVTEYPNGTQPHPHHFPLRNRIVAGLVKGVLVIEGGLKSGALITARIGADLGQDIWGVPGSVRNPMAQGPNELIRIGEAYLATRVEHIFERLAPGLVWDSPRESPPLALESLTSEEKAVLAMLDDVSVTPDRVVRVTGLSPGEVALSLSRLEVRGFVTRRHGGYEISGGGGRIRAALLDERSATKE